MMMDYDVELMPIVKIKNDTLRYPRHTDKNVVFEKGSHAIEIGNSTQQQTYIVPFYPYSHITKVC